MERRGWERLWVLSKTTLVKTLEYQKILHWLWLRLVSSVLTVLPISILTGGEKDVNQFCLSNATVTNLFHCNEVFHDHDD